MDKTNNKKIKMEKCLLCSRLTSKFWVVADDYDNLKPYHTTCRNRLVSTILKDAGMSIKKKTKKQNKPKIITTQREADKEYRRIKIEERKQYRKMSKTELIDKILKLETEIKDEAAGASL